MVPVFVDDRDKQVEVPHYVLGVFQTAMRELLPHLAGLPVKGVTVFPVPGFQPGELPGGDVRTQQPIVVERIGFVAPVDQPAGRCIGIGHDVPVLFLAQVTPDLSPEIFYEMEMVREAEGRKPRQLLCLVHRAEREQFEIRIKDFQGIDRGPVVRHLAWFGTGNRNIEGRLQEVGGPVDRCLVGQAAGHDTGREQHVVEMGDRFEGSGFPPGALCA
jgi:hypothetical protein